MDALTRFKSVIHRAQSTSTQPHAVTVRSWPPPAPADDDEEWDAVIARAKRPLPPELQITPPPVNKSPTR
jgi:hypothetical protein